MAKDAERPLSGTVSSWRISFLAQPDLIGEHKMTDAH